MDPDSSHQDTDIQLNKRNNKEIIKLKMLRMLLRESFLHRTKTKIQKKVIEQDKHEKL
jgi:hypothetical protein